MPFVCILYFDLYLATPCTLTRIWLHLVADAASRGFLALACIGLHLVADAASRGFLVLASRLATP